MRCKLNETREEKTCSIWAKLDYLERGWSDIRIELLTTDHVGYEIEQKRTGNVCSESRYSCLRAAGDSGCR